MEGDLDNFIVYILGGTVFAVGIYKMWKASNKTVVLQMLHLGLRGLCISMVGGMVMVLSILFKGP